MKEPFAIDFLALACHGQYHSPGPHHPWVAYEIKCSRGDYRNELKNPGKRAYAMSISHLFYFATPKGLLKKDEVRWEEPEDLTFEMFERERCPERCVKGPGKKTGRWGHDRWDEFRECATCAGKGYARKSWIELNAPTLWVPRGCGLIEIDDHGRARVRKQAPAREAEMPSHYHVALMLRHGIDPGFIRGMEFRKAELNWAKRDAEAQRKQAVEETQKVRDLLARRLGHTIEPGQRWERDRVVFRSQKRESVLVARVEGDKVWVDDGGAREWPWSVGEFLLLFKPPEGAATRAA